jgi:hypothetical protein
VTGLVTVQAETAAAVDLEKAETRALIEEIESRGHSVDYESDLDDFSDDDLIEELQERGMGDTPCNTREAIVEMFEAFYLGKNEAAIAIARRIAQDTTGRTLA